MTENSKHNQAQILISSVYYIERYNPRFDNVINVAQRSITLERTANEASRHDRERQSCRGTDGARHLHPLTLCPNELLRADGGSAKTFLLKGSRKHIRTLFTVLGRIRKETV